jgi:hypothetical protein
MKSKFRTYLEMFQKDEHDTGKHHEAGSKQSGSKATKNSVEFVTDIINNNKIEDYIKENKYVNSPARLALISMKDGFGGTGTDALLEQNVSKYYESMPEDMKEKETKEIPNTTLYWEKRMRAEIPCIVDKSKSPKKATHIAAILGPNNVIWATYPCAGGAGVAPPLNKASIEFWKKHVFAGGN